MRNKLLIQLVLVGMFAAARAVAADADPTVDQIYAAARAGHFTDAQQMMDQVLKDHPNSAKAHYVQAELYAREGSLAAARNELGRAEQLQPGLPKEDPRAVNELKAQLGLLSPAGPRYGAAPVHVRHSFPWGTVVLIGAGVLILFLIFRRRQTPMVYPGGATGYGAGYPQGPTPMPGPLPMQGGYGGPMMSPGLGGGGLMGNLATGLAVGAGVAAGEELVHHVLDGNRVGGIPPASAGEAPYAPPENADMGGNDFGVQDPGSWDDGGSSGGGDFGGGDLGGGGGGDWS